jgi:hypothetical protein
MLSFVRDHRGRDRMACGFTQSVSITIHAVSHMETQYVLLTSEVAQSLP